MTIYSIINNIRDTSEHIINNIGDIINNIRDSSVHM